VYEEKTSRIPLGGSQPPAPTVLASTLETLRRVLRSELVDEPALARVLAQLDLLVRFATPTNRVA
jgi:hypothetical protein